MHTIAPAITTERLILRAHIREDFAPIAALFTTPRSRYMDGPKPAGDVWRGFASDVGQWTLLGYGAWAITLHDGTYIGQVGINRPFDFPEDELGWLLFEGYERQGYACEAAVAARDFAFHEADLKTLVSYIDPDNAPSIRLAERLGAVRDPDAATPNSEACLVYRHTPQRALK